MASDGLSCGLADILAAYDSDPGRLRCEIGLAFLDSLCAVRPAVWELHESHGTPLVLRLAVGEADGVVCFVADVQEHVRSYLGLPANSKSKVLAAKLCKEFTDWCKGHPDPAWEMGFEFDEDYNLVMNCGVAFDVEDCCDGDNDEEDESSI